MYYQPFFALIWLNRFLVKLKSTYVYGTIKKIFRKRVVKEPFLVSGII